MYIWISFSSSSIRYTIISFFSETFQRSTAWFKLNVVLIAKLIRLILSSGNSQSCFQEYCRISDTFQNNINVAHVHGMDLIVKLIYLSINLQVLFNLNHAFDMDLFVKLMHGLTTK